MVFRRRDPLTWTEWLREAVWPRAGWRRALEYVTHRLRRLPDTPEMIGRGIWSGVLASFTPFFGLHFVVAIILSRIVRGNMIAALIGTFFFNPLTILPMGVAAMTTGKALLGRHHNGEGFGDLPAAFSAAGSDLWQNLGALFGRGEPDWAGLAIFWNDIFLPYLVGGLVTGAIVATICYALTVQLARAHQARRLRRLGNRLSALQKKPASPPDLPGPPG